MKEYSSFFLLSLVQRIFDEKFLVDDRTAIPVLTIAGYEISVLPLSIHFYVQMAIIFVSLLLAAIVASIIGYYFVVVPQKEEQRKPTGKQNGKSKAQRIGDIPTIAVLATFGIVYPIAFLFPFYIIDTLDIRSKTLRMIMIVLPLSVSLKILDTMFAIPSPKRYQRTKSLASFVYHMGFIFMPIYKNESKSINETKTNTNGIGDNAIKDTDDDDKVKLTVEYFTRLVLDFVRWLLITAIALSIFSVYNYKPFPSSDLTWTKQQLHENLLPTFEIQRLYNNYVVGHLVFLSLILNGSGIVMIATLIAGIQLDEQLFDGNPILISSSPSDFWGRRWNILMHECLKDAIYKPMLYFSTNRNKIFANLMTFVGSGLLHEYMVLLVTYVNVHEATEGEFCQTCYPFKFGKHIIFFGWNGILLLLEGLVGSYFRPLQKYLPPLVVGHLVCLLALPVSHLFTDDLIVFGYFEGLRLAVPMIQLQQVTA